MSEKKIGWCDVSMCWFCQRSVNADIMCQWAKGAKPVPGWDAVEDTSIRSLHGAWFVEWCPKFIPDEKILAAVMDAENADEFQTKIHKHYGNVIRPRVEKLYSIVTSGKDRFLRMGVDYKAGRKQLGVAISRMGMELPEEKPEPAKNLIRRKLYEYKGNSSSCRCLYGVRVLPKEIYRCTAGDCFYAGSLSGGGDEYNPKKGTSLRHCCNYLQITGKCRSIEDGKMVHLVQKNGRCDLYVKGKRKKRSAKERWGA